MSNNITDNIGQINVWLADRKEDYLKVVVSPPDATEAERLQLLSSSTIDVKVRRELIDSFRAAFGISTIPEALEGIREWQQENGGPTLLE
jgi:hypothetical protein